MGWLAAEFFYDVKIQGRTTAPRPATSNPDAHYEVTERAKWRTHSLKPRCSPRFFDVICTHFGVCYWKCTLLSRVCGFFELFLSISDHAHVALCKRHVADNLEGLIVAFQIWVSNTWHTARCATHYITWSSCHAQTLLKARNRGKSYDSCQVNEVIKNSVVEQSDHRKQWGRSELHTLGYVLLVAASDRAVLRHACWHGGRVCSCMSTRRS